MAKKSSSRKSRVTAARRETDASREMGLHEVVRLMKVIAEHGWSEKFARAAKKNMAFVTADGDTADFVSNFLVKNNLHKHPGEAGGVTARAATARPARGDRFKCF